MVGLYGIRICNQKRPLMPVDAYVLVSDNEPWIFAACGPD